MRRLRFHLHFLSLLLALVLVMPGGGQAQFLGYRLMNNRGSVKIPFETYNNLVVIPVKLNGIVPLKFVVDTGVRSSILTDKVITDVLQLPYSRKITVNGPGDYVILEAYVVNNVDILLEGAVGTDQSILVLQEDYLQLKNYLGIEVHGLIGYDLFNRFIVEINYANEFLILHEPKSYKPKRRYTSFPITIEDTKPYMNADIVINDTSQVTGKFMVDTGASHAIMLNEQSCEDINVPEPYLTSDIGRGLGGPISGKIAMIDELKIGEFGFEKVVTSFPDAESYPDTVGLVYRNGTLGGELLSRFKVVFDYFDEKIYLRKNSKFRSDFGYNMSGITVVAEGDELDHFKISDVREGSPAHREDIRVDDFIYDLNGVPLQDLSLNDIYKLFNYREGQKIRMHVLRDDTILRKTFRLEDILDPDD